MCRIANLVRGRWGEDLAAALVRRHGYDVVARNWRCPIGEIDLVVRRGRLLVVVRGEGPAHRRLRPGRRGRRAGRSSSGSGGSPPSGWRPPASTASRSASTSSPSPAADVDVIEAAF